MQIEVQSGHRGMRRVFLTDPIDARVVTVYIVMCFQLAIPGIPESMADGVRQVDVGRRDTQHAVDVLRAHDSMQWVLRLFVALDISCDVQDFAAVLRCKGTVHEHLARRNVVVDSPARRAKYAAGSCRLLVTP